MTHTCKNCHQQIIGKFCYDCGQKADTHEINWHFLWHDIQHGLLHFEKGILFSAKELLIRPGNTIREFIEGKRIQHFKPISLVLLLATIYGFLYHYFQINLFSGSFFQGFRDGFNIGNKSKFLIDYETLNDWLGTHYAWKTLFQIPFFSFATFLVFRKSGYNYVQNFVLNTFTASQGLVIHILLFPILFLFKKEKSDIFLSILGYISFLFIIWTYTQFFTRYPRFKVAILSLAAFLIGAILIAFAIGFSSFFYGIYITKLH